MIDEELLEALQLARAMTKSTMTKLRAELRALSDLDDRLDRLAAQQQNARPQEAQRGTSQLQRDNQLVG